MSDTLTSTVDATEHRQQRFKVSLPSSVIGAVVSEIDLSKPIDEPTFSEIDALFNERSVLCFRNQTLSEPQYLAFARRFGSIVKLYNNKYDHPNFPEILLISNIKVNNIDIGHADAGCVWHSDMSFIETPPRATLLYAREVPIRDGVPLGDTHFASAVTAYDALSEKQREKIDSLMVVHDVFGRRAERGTGKQDNDLRKKQPKVTHPFVRTHPITGRKCLFVSDGECVEVVGMEENEGRSLIDEYANHIIRKEFCYSHKWQVGDVLIWDNCAVQHLATHDYEWPNERRLLWRLTVGM